MNNDVDITQFGTAFSIDESEVSDYEGKPEAIIDWRKRNHLHELVDKVIEVKGDRLWRVDKGVPSSDLDSYTCEIYIFTADELKRYQKNLLKQNG